MKTELLVFSYAPDFWWAQYLVRSIEKFVTGFSQVTFVVPWKDRALFLPFEQRKTLDGARIEIKQYEPVPGRAHLSHQSMKCFADVWCPNADYMAFTDSDTIYSAPFNPSLLFKNGRPIIYCRPYKAYEGKPEWWWKTQVARAIKIDPEFATMEHSPEIYARSLFRSLRDRIEQTNFIPFQEYVVSQKPDPLWGFSEFSTLGAWALYSHRQEYEVINLCEESAQEMISLQYWSHTLRLPEYAEQHKKTVAEMEAILK